MRRRARDAAEKGPRYGRPRGWRPRAEEEVPDPRVERPGDADEGADDDADADAPDADYGIKILWGSGKRRPGMKLEKLARRALR